MELAHLVLHIIPQLIQSAMSAVSAQRRLVVSNECHFTVEFLHRLLFLVLGYWTMAIFVILVALVNGPGKAAKPEGSKKGGARRLAGCNGIWCQGVWCYDIWCHGIWCHEIRWFTFLRYD